MEKKTANIKVDADIHARFKQVIEKERYIGGTLNKLMLWYICADEVDRDDLLRGITPAAINRRLAKQDDATLTPQTSTQSSPGPSVEAFDALKMEVDKLKYQMELEKDYHATQTSPKAKKGRRRTSSRDVG